MIMTIMTPTANNIIIGLDDRIEMVGESMAKREKRLKELLRIIFLLCEMKWIKGRLANKGKERRK